MKLTICYDWEAVRNVLSDGKEDSTEQINKHDDVELKKKSYILSWILPSSDRRGK